MAPSYRPTASRGAAMDSATRRLAIFAGIIGAALLGLVGAWAVTSRHPGGVPVIEADSKPVRVKPADPGGMHVADAGESILSGEANAKQTLAPPPEAPAPQGLKAQEQAAANATAVAPAAPPAAPAAAPEEPLPRPSTTARTAGSDAGASQGGKLATDEPPPRQPLRPLARTAPATLMAQAATGSAHAADEPNLNTPMPHTAMPETTMPETKMPETKMPETTMPETKMPDATFKSTPLPPPDVTMTPPAGDAPAAATAVVPPPPMPEPAAPMAKSAAIERVAPVAHGKRPVVQFAALGSGSEALAEWHRLVKQYPDLLSDHTPTITKFAHDGKTFWRVRTAGFGTLSDAVVFCQKVKTRGGQCIATF